MCSYWTGFTLGLEPSFASTKGSLFVFVLNWGCLLNTPLSLPPSLLHSWTPAPSTPLLLIPDTLPLPKMDTGPCPALEGREAETNASWDICVPVRYTDWCLNRLWFNFTFWIYDNFQFPVLPHKVLLCGVRSSHGHQLFAQFGRLPVD